MVLCQALVKRLPAFVEAVERIDERLVRTVVGFHLGSLRHLSREPAVAGKISSSEAVDALLGIADHQKRLDIVVQKKPLENSDLDLVAILALIDDDRLEPLADLACQGRTFLPKRSVDGEQDVVEAPLVGVGFPFGIFLPDLPA